MLHHHYIYFLKSYKQVCLAHSLIADMIIRTASDSVISELKNHHIDY